MDRKLNELYLDIYSFHRRIVYILSKVDYIYVKVKLFRSFIGKSGKIKKSLSFVFNTSKDKPDKSTKIIKVNSKSYSKLIDNFHMIIIEKCFSDKNMEKTDKSGIIDIIRNSDENSFYIELIDEQKLRKFLSKEDRKPNYYKNIKLSKIYKELSNLD